MNPSQAIVVRAFYTSDDVAANVKKIAMETRSLADTYFFYDEKPGRVKRSQIPNCVKVASFNQDNWHAYKRADPFHKTFIPGNEETAFLMFFDRHPSYDYYWFIEYDVRFTGDWRTFIGHFTESNADLLTTTLVDFNEIPDWHIWKSLTPPMGQVADNIHKVRAFFPVCRFSRQALQHIKNHLATGWSGHPEALLGTLLKIDGLNIEDIGGEGRYVAEHNVGRFYTNNRMHDDLAPGSFVFRPKMAAPGDKPDTLWHPVKPDQIAVWDTPTRKNIIRRAVSLLFPKIKPREDTPAK